MERLIDATRIEQYILNNCSDNEEINAIYAEVINAPTVEAVRHGHWEYVGGNLYRCSVCHKGLADDDNILTGRENYCGVCGAKMDEEVERKNGQ